MENVIDLQKILKLVRERWILIITFAIIGGLGAYAISNYVVTKKYESTVSLLVNSENINTNAQFANQQADVQLINTYKNIVTQPIILNDVAHNLSTNQKIKVKSGKKAVTRINRFGAEVIVEKAVPATYRYVPAKYNINASDLVKMISITNDANSQVFKISVKSKSAQESSDIANEIAKVFKLKIVKLMNVKNVNIVSDAIVNKLPVFPNIKLSVVLGVFVGILLAISIVIIRDITDKSIKATDFLVNNMAINDLGTMFIVNKVPSYKEYVEKNTNLKLDAKQIHRRRI